MDKQSVLIRATILGSAIGSGAATVVAATGDAGKGVVRGAKFSGTVFSALGAGIRTGWKDKKANIKVISKVETTQVVPSTIILPN